VFGESLASPLSPLFRATLGGALSSVPDDNHSIPGIGAAPLRLTCASDARLISTLSVGASPLSNLLAHILRDSRPSVLPMMHGTGLGGRGQGVGLRIEVLRASGSCRRLQNCFGLRSCDLCIYPPLDARNHVNAEHPTTDTLHPAPSTLHRSQSIPPPAPNVTHLTRHAGDNCKDGGSSL